ncbi:oligosaccharide flippase family protein [Bacillus toyonensis]|uniref:oligosaccharide flippase family protein n=1 Tax=Bacillus toyonensis TaxID=155322 RepID=UPI001904DD54|nr:oligosaccharide flippase family protein [Bacillus toyonensis]QQN83535.1 oligosaccharide flippase family protein [Bacillus toyonensis]
MNELIKKVRKKGFFHIFSANVFNKIIQFCSGIFLVRLLTQSEFGNYSYAQNILNIFLIFNGLGVLYALLQFGSESDTNSKRNSYFKFGFKVGISFNVVIVLVMCGYGLFIDFPNNQTRLALFMMLLMPFTMFSFEYVQNYLRTGLHNIEFSRLSTLNTFLIFGFSVIGSILNGVYGVIMGVYIAYLVSIIVGFFFINKKGKLFSQTGKISKNDKKEFLNYSIISMFSNAVSQLVYLIDIFLIGLLIRDTEVLAIYKTATLIPFALNFIPLSIMTFIYPYFAKNREDKEWIRQTYIKIQKALVVFNLIIVIILVLTAPIIVRILFGENYLESVTVFRILCIAYLLGGSFRIPAGNVLAMLRKVKFLFVTNIVVGVINICLDFILIKYFAAIGAAITTLVIILITSIIYNIYLYYQIRTS